MLGIPLVDETSDLATADHLVAPPQYNVGGLFVGGRAYWTGSECNGWSDAGANGHYEFSDETTDWLLENPNPCTNRYSVLCFEE